MLQSSSCFSPFMGLRSALPNEDDPFIVLSVGPDLDRDDFPTDDRVDLMSLVLRQGDRHRSVGVTHSSFLPVDARGRSCASIPTSHHASVSVSVKGSVTGHIFL